MWPKKQKWIIIQQNQIHKVKGYHLAQFSQLIPNQNLGKQVTQQTGKNL